MNNQAPVPRWARIGGHLYPLIGGMVQAELIATETAMCLGSGGELLDQNHELIGAIVPIDDSSGQQKFTVNYIA